MIDELSRNLGTCGNSLKNISGLLVNMSLVFYAFHRFIMLMTKVL